MRTEIEILCCPECGAEVDCTIRHNGFKAASTVIGPPLLPCPDCSTLVRTNQCEWDEMSLLAKTRFLFFRVVWLVIGSVLTAGPFTAIASLIALEYGWIRIHQKNSFLAVCFCIATMLICAFLTRSTVGEIRSSLRRSATKAVPPPIPTVMNRNDVEVDPR